MVPILYADYGMILSFFGIVIFEYFNRVTIIIMHHNK